MVKHLSQLQREACNLQSAATSNSYGKVQSTVKVNTQEWHMSYIFSAKSGSTWLHRKRNAIGGIGFFLCTFEVRPHWLCQHLESTKVCTVH